MRIRYLCIIPLFLSALPYDIKSQVNCTVPEAPVLNSVSVEPETGNVLLNWDLSLSSGIAAYVLYTYKNEDGIPFDTIWNPEATSYIYNTAAIRYFSVSFVVAAHRMPSCTSPFSNNLNTIYAEAQIDTCNRKISLSWTRYLPQSKKVTGYTVMTSINGENFLPFASLSEDEVNFIFDDFITDAEYCFFIIAELEDGTESKSNKTCLSTEMQRPPDWINADFATINSEKKISLSFTVDPLSEISDFSLERKTGRNGSFSEISRIRSVNGTVLFTDDKAETRSVNLYRLAAINSCSKPITYSNLASNIVLSLEQNSSNIILRWNHYMEWMGSVDAYRIFVDTGTGYNEMSETSASDSSFIIDYRDIMYDITSGEVCFEISAAEVSNPHGVAGMSISQEVCITPTEIITVPDVFTPNNDLINDLFKPVLSFTPLEYHLVISSRQGEILFETRNFNESWNGTHNGDPVTQGSCLWFVTVLTPSRKTISKSGTLTIYYNR